MLIKIAIVLVFLIIIGSLFSGLYFLAKDKSGSERTVKALTVRITVSIVLFILLLVGFWTGLIGQQPM